MSKLYSIDHLHLENVNIDYICYMHIKTYVMQTKVR